MLIKVEVNIYLNNPRKQFGSFIQKINDILFMLLYLMSQEIV